MICPFCFASEPYYFDGDTCRRCLPYRGYRVEESYSERDRCHLEMPHELTEVQKWVANELVERCRNQHICVEAVCGAGKTEMCVPLIAYCLNQGMTIGWATPRRQIVIELRDRLQSYFPHANVVGVYGDHTEITHGDLIICTTHQIYRYHQTFDVLILDEPDAFPFKGNDLLLDFLKASLRGYCVFLSATYDDNQFTSFGPVHKLSVNQRPSMEPLSVPELTMNRARFFKVIWELRDEKVLVFVPTIQHALWLSRLFQCKSLTSKSRNAQATIEGFRNAESGLLITTTVLERGVTFEDCFVVVYDAGHPVFDEASLIQISGRVRRGMNPTKGSCLFYVREKSEVVDACINRIKVANDAGYALHY